MFEHSVPFGIAVMGLIVYGVSVQVPDWRRKLARRSRERLQYLYTRNRENSVHDAWLELVKNEEVGDVDLVLFVKKDGQTVEKARGLRPCKQAATLLSNSGNMVRNSALLAQDDDIRV